MGKPALILALLLSGCVRTRYVEVPQPYPVPDLVETPVVVPDSALIEVMQSYLDRYDAHPQAFDVIHTSDSTYTVRFRRPVANQREAAAAITRELAWYYLWARDVAAWLRGRVE